jgi:hypothetical protein
MMTTPLEQKNIELARRCLVLIRDIAERGASSWGPGTGRVRHPGTQPGAIGAAGR